jgi:hypothetical protein
MTVTTMGETHMTEQPKAAELMAFMDQIGQYVAMVTGMKNQLLSHGWSDAAAETIVVQALKGTGGIK